jgi:hypothetical protein
MNQHKSGRNESLQVRKKWTGAGWIPLPAWQISMQAPKDGIVQNACFPPLSFDSFAWGTACRSTVWAVKSRGPGIQTSIRENCRPQQIGIPSGWRKTSIHSNLDMCLLMKATVVVLVTGYSNCIHAFPLIVTRILYGLWVCNGKDVQINPFAQLINCSRSCVKITIIGVGWNPQQLLVCWLHLHFLCRWLGGTGCILSSSSTGLLQWLLAIVLITTMIHHLI